MKLYPFKFKPIFKRRIWGGQKLKTIFNKDLPAGEKIGESWEIADLPEDKSVIANGSMAGQTIAQTIQQFPKEITGFDTPLPFPLLIKLLDANDILSVQVHPDKETCKKMNSGDPKTECWYIIDAEKNSFIYKGLKNGTTKQQFSKAIHDGTVENYLVKMPVKPGQCHFIPAGTAHAIGPGLLMAEIQTPSDTTYRVFDWNRLDENGKSRQLHIEQALESIHFDRTAPLPVTTTGRLIDCEFFKIDKFSQVKNSELTLACQQMKTLMILSGSGTILSQNAEAVEFQKGQTILIPACLKCTIRFETDSQLLKITI